MTALRDRMIRELEPHRKAPKTVQAYLSAVTQLAQHYHRSPDRISPEEVRDFLHHLITQRRVAYSTCNQKVAGIRFFYRHVLGQENFSLHVTSQHLQGIRSPLELLRLPQDEDVTDEDVAGKE